MSNAFIVPLRSSGSELLSTRRCYYAGRATPIQTLTMGTKFYLVSHDYVSSPEPRECELMRRIMGTQGQEFHLVRVRPDIPLHMGAKPVSISQLLIHFCHRGIGFDDIGNREVLVDILLWDDANANVVDEGGLYRVGIGSLHSSYAAAAKDSPLD